MKNFDLIEYQEQARKINHPRELFELWDEVCRIYECGRIGKYELDEMKVTIWPALQCLTQLKHQIDRPAA